VRTIAIVNQKGGSGKTTTAINLAASLARNDQRVLLVDLDPQGHCALGLAIPENQIEYHIGDALLCPDHRPIDRERLFWQVGRNFDLLPSTTRLAALEAARGGLAEREDRDRRLAAILATYANAYDWCLLDCPPFIGLLTFNALRACDEVLIPVETSFFALQGAAKQVNTINAVARKIGFSIPYRVLPTMHHPESPLALDVIHELEQRFEGSLIPQTIRYDPRLKDSVSAGVPIIEFHSESEGASDYFGLACYYEASPSLESVPLEAPVVPPLVSPLSMILSQPLQPSPTGNTESTGIETEPAIPLPLPMRNAVPLVSRAAELAARARRLSDRGNQTHIELETDPEVSRLLRDLSTPVQQPDPIPACGAEGVGGVAVTPDGILFSYPGDADVSVSIVGDHNGWTPDATPMRFNPQTRRHEVLVTLPPGKFRYRLLSQGRCFVDPHNPRRESNGLGDDDSVVVVPATAPVLNLSNSAAIPA